MSWADDLSAAKARREAWQAEHGPALRERDRLQREAREKATSIFHRLPPEDQAALAPFISILPQEQRP